MGIDAHQPNCGEDAHCPPIPNHWQIVLSGYDSWPVFSGSRGATVCHGGQASGMTAGSKLVNTQAAYVSSMTMQSVLLSGANEAVDEALREYIAKREAELPEGVE